MNLIFQIRFLLVLLLWSLNGTAIANHDNLSEISTNSTTNKAITHSESRLYTDIVVTHSNYVSRVFQGLSCHPFSIFPKERCLYSKSCCCNSTCVSWEQGRLQLKGNGRLNVYAGCRRSNSTRSKASFHAGIWTYEDNCNLKIYNPIEANHILQKSVVVFIGDSMLRQLFLRMIWHLRDFEEIVEHYFHANAIYVRNNTHDHLYLTIKPAVTIFEEFTARPFQEIVNPTMIFIFMWDPRMERLPMLQTTLKAPSLRSFQKVVVSGVHYWYKQNTTADLGHKLHKLATLMNSNGNTKGSSFTSTPLLIWYPTPGRGSMYAARNKFVADTIRNKSYPILVLPSEEMGADNTIAPNEADKIHYQCSFLNHFQQPLVSHRYKTPKSGDCRDMFNYNLAQLIYNMIFRKFRLLD